MVIGAADTEVWPGGWIGEEGVALRCICVRYDFLRYLSKFLSLLQDQTVSLTMIKWTGQLLW